MSKEQPTLKENLRASQIWNKVLVVWLCLTAFISFAVFCMFPYQNLLRITEGIVFGLAFNLMAVGSVFIVFLFSPVESKIKDEKCGGSKK